MPDKACPEHRRRVRHDGGSFIEGGALAWPNGFELSADALHQQLEASGALVRDAA